MSIITLRALDRKLLHELWQLKGQLLSIALIVATGIMTLVTMRGSYESLVQTQQRYYRDTHFADVWVSLKRAPQSLNIALNAIEGVRQADTRLSFLTSLDLPGLDMPAQGLFVSLPDQGNNPINNLRLLSGRLPQPDSVNEILISNKFSDARNLQAGGSLKALLNGKLRRLHVVGTAISPEHAYSVPPGSLYPDDERYGVMWMNHQALAAAFDMDGAFNQAIFSVSADALEESVISNIDRQLHRFGGLGAYSREKQASHQILQSELDQNRVMGTVFPAAFMAVASFLLSLVLGRMIATQRTEIAVLKAFGYRNTEVGSHYLMFALIAVISGASLGALVGIWLGGHYVALYGQYFNFPALSFTFSPGLFLFGLLISLVSGIVGAWFAISRAVSLAPAEAMRPESPANFKAGWTEKLGLTQLFGTTTRMIVRNLERKPLQTGLSVLGIALSTSILVLGLYLFDSIRLMMELQFEFIQREDLSVSFDNALSPSVLTTLGRLEGVSAVEPWRSSPIRMTHGHLQENTVIQGFMQSGKLRRLVAQSGRVHPIPGNGMVLSKALADKLAIKPGDTVQVEFLEGQRQRRSVPVHGIIEDFLGMGATTDIEYLHRLASGPAQISGVNLALATEHQTAINVYLKSAPAVMSVSSPKKMLSMFNKQMSESLYISIGLLVGFASIIAIGIIYNSARIALSERGRELASLRVMGFRRREVNFLLFGEQAIMTVLAIPLGWVLGYAFSSVVHESLQTDTYRLPFFIAADTYLWAALATASAAIVSGLLLRQRINHLDLVEALKTRE